MSGGEQLFLPITDQGEKMNFFKANSYDIVKIYITQFGIAIFSTMLYLSAGMINADNTVAWWISLIISIFATGFFFALLYCSAWEWGGKDKIRADGGKLVIDNTKALKMGLLGNVPNLVLTVIAFTAFLVCSFDKTSFIGPIGATCATITRFTAAMYQGIVKNSLNFLHAEAYGEFTFYIFEAVAFLLLSLISVLVIHFGYIMGVKEKKLFAFMKNDKKYE